MLDRQILVVKLLSSVRISWTPAPSQPIISLGRLIAFSKFDLYRLSHWLNGFSTFPFEFSASPHLDNTPVHVAYQRAYRIPVSEYAEAAERTYKYAGFHHLSPFLFPNLHNSIFPFSSAAPLINNDVHPLYRNARRYPRHRRLRFTRLRQSPTPSPNAIHRTSSKVDGRIILGRHARQRSKCYISYYN